MKNDPFFKIIAAIVIAGVLVALFSPTHVTASNTPSHAASAPAAEHAPAELTQ